MPRSTDQKVVAQAAESVWEMQIRSDADVIKARRRARDTAHDFGFPRSECIDFARGVGELSHNAWSHAGGGQVKVHEVRDGDRRGLRVAVSDAGPGIPDIATALERHGPTERRGLAGVELVLGPLAIATSANGTIVRATIWERPQARAFRQRVGELI